MPKMIILGGASPIILNLCLIAAALMIPLSTLWRYDPVYGTAQLAADSQADTDGGNAAAPYRSEARPHFSFRPLSAKGAKCGVLFCLLLLGQAVCSWI